MKSPNESYIQSPNLSPDLPIIILYIPQVTNNDNLKGKQLSNEYPVSIDFLKSIGARTIHVPTLSNAINTQSNLSSENSQTIQTFIQNLVQQRKTMSDNDLRALKHNHCITG
jgi:hypothetical protein